MTKLLNGPHLRSVLRVWKARIEEELKPYRDNYKVLEAKHGLAGWRLRFCVYTQCSMELVTVDVTAHTGNYEGSCDACCAFSLAELRAVAAPLADVVAMRVDRCIASILSDLKPEGPKS
jgi:hypothetical protein